MFYLQSYRHSWFIQFSRGCNIKFSAWFQKWTFFSLLESIFLHEIQEKSNFYKSKTSTQSISQPRLLTFYSGLRILWILIWNIIKKQEQHPPFPLSLSREFNIKCWDKFNQEFVCQQKILKIISRPGSSNSKGLTSSSQGPNQVEFLTLKSKCQASLAIATDLEQYHQELSQTLQQFGDNQDDEGTEEIALSNDLYVGPEQIIYGGPMGQPR